MVESAKCESTTLDTGCANHLGRYGGLGAIPAISAPAFVDVETATASYAADEPLLVVSRAGDVRGYSTWHLDHHEVVNDRFDDLPLAVTW
jgi:hypothetical protein